MSMVMGLTTIRDASYALVREHPELWGCMVGDGPYETPPPAPPKPPGLLARLFGKQREPAASAPEPEPLPELTRAEGEGEELDLDKSWNGLHYLFTGISWDGDPPMNFLLGGEEFGEEMDYGAQRFLSSSEVAAVAEALRGLDEAELRRRFKPEEMMALDIYPGIWDRDPAEDDTFGYLLDYFYQLREFVEKAANRGMGLVLMMT